jgi:RNA polymerase sigma-70 factor (ECF subfamily)
LGRLQAALDRLPPRCRQAIVLRRVEGYSQKEVAKIMGVTEGTVESQVMRGVRILTNAASGWHDPDETGAWRFWKWKD